MVSGGQLLRFTYDGGGSNLVVDPNTAAAKIEGFTTFGGGKQSMGDNTMTSGWTNTLPSKIVPLPKRLPGLRSRG